MSLIKLFTFVYHYTFISILIPLYLLYIAFNTVGCLMESFVFRATLWMCLHGSLAIHTALMFCVLEYSITYCPTVSSMMTSGRRCWSLNLLSTTIKHTNYPCLEFWAWSCISLMAWYCGCGWFLNKLEVT